MQNQSDWAKDLGLFSVIVTELVAFTGVGFGLGYWVRSQWGWPSWLFVLLGLAGFGLGVYRVYRIAKKAWLKD